MKIAGWIVGIAAGFLLFVFGCVTQKKEYHPADLYKSDSGRAVAFWSYDRALELWTIRNRQGRNSEPRNVGVFG